MRGIETYKQTFLPAVLARSQSRWPYKEVRRELRSLSKTQRETYGLLVLVVGFQDGGLVLLALFVASGRWDLGDFLQAREFSLDFCKGCIFRVGKAQKCTQNSGLPASQTMSEAAFKMASALVFLSASPGSLQLPMQVRMLPISLNSGSLA